MKQLILLVALAATFSSCKKEAVEGPQGPQGPAGPAGSAPPGVITGKVIQYDQHAEIYTTPLNTVTVSIKGTTLSSVTDTKGYYSIAGVNSGIYDLKISKPGAGTMENQQLSYPGKDTLFHNLNIFDRATHSILTCTLKDTSYFGGSQPTIYLKVGVTSHPKQRGLVMIYGNKPLPDINIPESFDGARVLTINSNTTSVLINSGYAPPSGLTYFKVYPYSLAFNSIYRNVRTDKTIYPNAGPEYSTIFSISRP